MASRKRRKGTRYRQSVYFAKVAGIVAVYRRLRREAEQDYDLPETINDAIWDWAKSQSKLHKLNKCRQDRVVLIGTSVAKMVGRAHKVCRGLRRMLKYTMAVATKSTTGLRHNSLMRGTSAKNWASLPEKKRGVRWRDLTLWVKRSPGGDDTSNDFVGYLSPRHFKTKGVCGRGKSFPLFKTPYLGTSAAHVAIMQLYYLAPDEMPDVEELLSPKFLDATRGRARKLVIPPSLGVELTGAKL